MGHHYSHLTLTDRRTIERMLNLGISKAKIAEALHVHPSTIYREIKRCTMIQLTSELIPVERYNPDGAEKRYRDNLSAKGAPLKIGNDIALAFYLERKIKLEGRSPAAALADIYIEGCNFSVSLSAPTVYSYINKGVFLSLTNADLPVKPRRKRKYRHYTINRAPRGQSIEKRPSEVSERNTFGHWEMDTVYSRKKKKEALLVLTERMTRKEIIEKLPDRTAESTVQAVNRIERRYGDSFNNVFKSITVDNGVEFSDCSGMETSPFTGQKRTTVYYCHPYSSYERGSNENQNKMIRRKFPKGTDFGSVSEEDIKNVEEWINSYPRKVLGWKTSNDLFNFCTANL